eukprot:4603685-Karenia_brevis.AAC.1
MIIPNGDIGNDNTHMSEDCHRSGTLVGNSIRLATDISLIDDTDHWSSLYEAGAASSEEEE